MKKVELIKNNKGQFMKTVEEKAKAYDEALKKAKRWYVDAQLDFKKSLETLLPELKESEDERIRKELIDYHHSMAAQADDYVHEAWIAWLEKQGEQKSLYVRFGDIPDNEQSKIYNGENEICIENGVSVYPAFIDGDNVILGLTLPITKTTLYTQQHLLEYDARPCYLVTGDYVGKGTDGEPLIKNISIIKEIKDYRIKELEKQGEQKSTDKDEPKFKVGNWYQCTKDFFGKGVTFDKDTAYYCAQEGCLQDEYGCHIAIVKDLYDNFKLWTIQDAKEGDILKEDSCIFILQKLNDNNTAAKTYCTLHDDGDFEDGSMLYFDVNSTKPATKDQCNLLFQKMKEEGYEWDADKKELKKIEPVWSKEDEQKYKDWYDFIRWFVEQRIDKFTHIPSNDDIHKWSDNILNHAEKVLEPKTAGEVDNYDHKKVPQTIINKQKSWSNGNKKLTDVNHEYFSELLENDDSTDINYYAYQVAYCMSHDWVKDNATWEDIQQACKLGAEWNEKHYKSAWSEEDEKIIKRIDSLLYAINDSYFEDIHVWLKFLKGRTQPKQEWSEDDEKMVNDIIAAIDTLYYHGMVKWLKSLKQRYAWKPSDEQIKAFEHFVRSIGESGYASPYENNTKLLHSLLEQLKKLKG